MRRRSENALSSMIGKIVSGIVLTENAAGHPRSQVFITFSDGTSYEFWSDDDLICTGSDFDSHLVNDIATVQERRPGTSVKVFRPQHEDPDNPQPDMLSSKL